MTDIATIWSQEIARGDYALTPAGSLQADQDLATAVILSLFTDRTAHADDVIPDGGGRRGWWGDAYRRYPLGSRLWLLWREKETEDVRLRAEQYAQQATEWMILEGVASAIEIAAAWTGPGRLELTIIIIAPPGNRIGWRFALAWGQLVGMQRISGIII
jgi:phage gp46-like protein